jgi:cobalt-zinc-cadmium resistance protein CzcA
LLNIEEDISVPFDQNYHPLQAQYMFRQQCHCTASYRKSFLSGNADCGKNKKVEKSLGLPDFTIGYTNQSLIGFQTINGWINISMEETGFIRQQLVFLFL